MFDLQATITFHQSMADAHASYAKALLASKHSIKTPATPAAPAMTDRMTWYARHGSVLKQINYHKSVSFAEFLSIAQAAGYHGNTYGQLLRHDGLLTTDAAKTTVKLNKRGETRLKEATAYLQKRGYTL